MEGKETEEKGFLGKVKDIAEDKEHQIEFLGTIVRLGVVVWSGFIITMNYVEIPMVKKSGNSDITFVASVFTGALATFGLSGFFIIGQLVGGLLLPFLPVVKPKVAKAPVNTDATKVISELPDFFTIGIST